MKNMTIEERMKMEEQAFAWSVSNEVHELFDQNKVWDILGEDGKCQKKLSAIIFKAIKLINKKYIEWLRSQPDKDKIFVNTDRLLCDVVFGYLVGSKDVQHYSRGGYFISTMVSLGVLSELCSQLEMFFEDDELAHFNYRNPYLNKILK